jgi:hypothetical protein
MKIEMEISLDDGLTWGGYVIEDSGKGRVLYPLWMSATVPEGVLIHRGQTVQTSSIGVELPQVANTNRLIRGRLLMSKNQTVAVNCIVERP